MAVHHKHVVLPPFKLTKRSSTGVQVRDVHRSVFAHRCAPLEPPEAIPNADDVEESHSLLLEEPMDSEVSNFALEELTHHELQSRASVESWGKLRKMMISTAMEGCAMPIAQQCLLCPSPALFRCQQCGPVVYYCSDCFCKQHESANFGRYCHIPKYIIMTYCLLLMLTEWSLYSASFPEETPEHQAISCLRYIKGCSITVYR